MKVKSESEVAQSCPTLSDPMDCSLPGPSVHGIFQARVLAWVAIAFSNPVSESDFNALIVLSLILNTSFVLSYFIQKTKIMASGPITSWQIDGETVETVSDFIFFGSKITADGDCTHEIKDTYSLEGKL